MKFNFLDALMAGLQNVINHIKFRHSNWPKNTPICVIEPIGVDGQWLNLMVGLNGCGKSTLLKCIEWVCNINKPLRGKELNEFMAKLASHGVDFFEISVTSETTMSPANGLMRITWGFHRDMLMSEFRKKGLTFEDGKKEEDWCHDWWIEGGDDTSGDSEWHERIFNYPEDCMDIDYISRFDIRKRMAELEIIPKIRQPGFYGFSIQNGKLVKEDIDFEIKTPIILPPILRKNEAIYPSIGDRELYNQIEEEFSNMGLIKFEVGHEFHHSLNDFAHLSPLYPRVHRIESKAAFEVDEEFIPGLELLDQPNKLRAELSEISEMEWINNFNIERNLEQVPNWGEPSLTSPNDRRSFDIFDKGTVWIIHDIFRLEIDRENTIYDFGWRHAKHKDWEPWYLDHKTKTHHHVQGGGKVIYNEDKYKLISFLQSKFLEIEGGIDFVMEHQYGIDPNVIAALRVVKKFSESYKFGGYLTDGQARLASLISDILTQPFDILLIDEPETSMHIDWQRNLVATILHEARFRNSIDHTPGFTQIFITTHSPDVIFNHLDMVTELISRNDGGMEP